MAIPNEHPRIPEWTLGERMAKARQSAGYTQAQMGAFFDVGDGTISTWENETRQPKKFFDVLRRWAELCNVDFDWLVTGSGTIVTYDDGIVIVDEDQPRLPIDLPPARKTADLSLV